MTKNIKFVITRFVFTSSNSTKIRFRPPLGELTTGAGITLPARRLRRLELGAYDASVLSPPPPQHKILVTPVKSDYSNVVFY